MKRIVLRLVDLVKKGEITFMLKGISKRILSKTKTFGLKRDLRIPLPIPDAKIDISIRHFKKEDEQFFSMDLQNDGLVEKDIPSCYVAVTSDDKPCYRQWIIGSEHKIKIKEFWGDSFPILKDDEMLLENGFAIPEMRGKGIMPAAITRIIESEKRPDITSVITFVDIDNIPSLKGCHRSGFSPYTLRTDTWFLFKRTVTFEDVPNDLKEAYSKNVGLIN